MNGCDLPRCTNKPILLKLAVPRACVAERDRIIYERRMNKKVKLLGKVKNDISKFQNASGADLSNHAKSIKQPKKLSSTAQFPGKLPTFIAQKGLQKPDDTASSSATYPSSPPIDVSKNKRKRMLTRETGDAQKRSKGYNRSDASQNGGGAKKKQGKEKKEQLQGQENESSQKNVDQARNADANTDSKKNVPKKQEEKVEDDDITRHLAQLLGVDLPVPLKTAAETAAKKSGGGKRENRKGEAKTTALAPTIHVSSEEKLIFAATTTTSVSASAASSVIASIPATALKPKSLSASRTNQTASTTKGTVSSTNQTASTTNGTASSTNQTASTKSAPTQSTPGPRTSSQKSSASEANVQTRSTPKCSEKADAKQCVSKTQTSAVSGKGKSKEGAEVGAKSAKEKNEDSRQNENGVFIDDEEEDGGFQLFSS